MYHNVFKLNANPQFIECARRISSSAALESRSCFRGIFWDKRGSTKYLETRHTLENPLYHPHNYGDRKPGITSKNGTFQFIPEMMPDIIVPDLTGFKLKPYISFRAPDVKREEFTAKHLFTAVYQSKIVEDFKSDGLLEDGTPKSPSKEENLSAEEATLNARQTGSDIFAEDPLDPDPIERIYRW